MCMTQGAEERSVKRDYKSRMFTMIFRDKKELLQLYNAVGQRNYQDPELLTINTLENAIYMSMQNDLSFIIDSRLSLYEHQSSYNPNLPLRFLLYLSDLYEKMIAGKNVYGTKLIPIPAPKFIVFYNGQKERPERETIKLSDAYMTQDEEVSLELCVDVLNINVGHNKELLQTCKTLGDYAEFVYRVRVYAKTMSIEDAVDRAIDECIKEGILREFLEKNRAEAKSMSIYEYNEEEHIKLEREDAFEDGRVYGMKKGLLELIEKKLNRGDSVEKIADDLMEDVEKIRRAIEEKNRAEAKSMSIYEYDQEEHIKLEREDAFEDGRVYGIEEGRLNKLKEQVRKKLAKGQTAQEIADALEENIEEIEIIIKRLQAQ